LADVLQHYVQLQRRIFVFPTISNNNYMDAQTNEVQQTLAPRKILE